MIRRALVAVGGLIAILTSAGVAGIWFSPLEIAQVPAPHLAALCLATGVALSIFKIWRWALAMLGCLLWHLALWLPNSGSGPLPVPSNVGRIVLLSNSNQRAVDYVRSQMPELVVISDRSDGGNDRLTDLAKLYPNSVGLDSGSGMAILARDGIPLDPVGPTQNDAPLLLARTVIDGHAFVIGAVHLTRPFPLGEIGRQRAEALSILETMRRVGEPMVLAGDFNATPWMTTMGMFRRSGAFTWDFGLGTWPSWAPDLVRIPLDQILIGNGQMLGKAFRGPDVGGSHLPMEVHLGVWAAITVGGP